MLLTRITQPCYIPSAASLSQNLRLQCRPRVLPTIVLRMASNTTTSSADTTAAPAIQFAAGYPAAQGKGDVAGLLSPAGAWCVTADGKGIERLFRFAGFRKTWEFMNLVAAEAAVRNHHPEWSNVYNTAFVRWTTHEPAGLSEKDVMMARFCDKKAQEMRGLSSQGRHGNEARALIDQLSTQKDPST